MVAFDVEVALHILDARLAVDTSYQTRVILADDGSGELGVADSGVACVAEHTCHGVVGQFDGHVQCVSLAVEDAIVEAVGAQHIATYHDETLVGSDIIGQGSVQFGHSCRNHCSEHSQ